MKVPLFKRQISNGFALIATILLMVLLAIITVGTLSLSVVTLRTGNQDSAQARARANARMALVIAVGELQKQMGADQRISAKSDILDQDLSKLIHRHWTGSWGSWKAGDSTSGQHRTIQGVADDMAPTYLPNRNDHFRKWLVSLTDAEASSISTPRSLNLQASSLPGSADNAIFLVAKGSLGDNSASSNDFVAARLLDIKDMNSSQVTGRYGWWVGDESLKARIMDDSYAAQPNLTSVDKIFRNQAPASMGNTSVRGLKDIQNDADLGRIPSLATIDLVEGAVDRPAKKNFHDVTPFSFSVLSDVREGGLKRDLSTLLERPVDPNERSVEYMLYKFNVKDVWANDTAKYPTLPVTPQECVPIQDLAAFYQLYNQSRKAGIKYTSTALPNCIQLSNPDYGIPSHTDPVNGWRAKFLKEYTTLYRNPVPVKVQFLISVFADPITATDRAAMWSTYTVNRYVPLSDTHKLRFAIIPAVTMWNPYNVPIVMESGATRSQQLVMKAPPLHINVKKIRADGITTSANLPLDGIVSERWGGGRGDLLKLNFARTAPIVFQPGEVRVFAASTTSPYFMAQNQMFHDNQSLNSGKNLVDAASGWNPYAILTARMSYSGYKIGQCHTNPTGVNLVNLMNYLYEAPTATTSNRWSFTMNKNSSDKFEFTVGCELATTAWPNEGSSPEGSAFSFYMAQRNYSAQGDGSGKGYNFLSMRHMSLVSRFGGGSNATNGTQRAANHLKYPKAFNEQIIKQGSTTIDFWTPMEPITAATMAAASGAGETVPFIQLALMAGCETSEIANGGLVAGRKFASRPFLHSSPIQPTVIDKVDGIAHYNHGWNWWIDEMNSVLESMVQESTSGNGFYGGGYSTESGVTHIVQQEIPVTPPISIASLSHARLGGFTLANEVPVAEGYGGLAGEGIDGAQSAIDDPSPTLGFQRVTATGQGGLYPHVLQAIGNSYANPNLAPGVAYNPAWKRLCDQDDGERDVVFADHSYLANKALWDDYFFSSITPQSNSVEIFGTTSRDAKQVASDFFFASKPLPNRRITPYQNNLDQQEIDTLFAAKDTFTNGLADKIAGHLMVEGPFNVNSTSVQAWKVFFSSLKGKPIAYLDGGKAPKEAATGITAPIGMGSLPIGLPAATADTEDPRDTQQWKGLRVITEDEIDALAQAMVREVKKRGPFLSLSEFVNRRLDSNNTDGMALKGALQAALDYDGADGKGPEVAINKNFRSDARKLDDEVKSINFEFQKAAEGPAAYGSSAYVDQADVLRQFAEQLTPRGDTFVIRTYGDALDKNGKVLARAWCEAVVQRTPDYVDSADENHVRFSQLSSEANKRFGRNFQIYSLRWLNSSEI
ncbi:MAG: hypothetical protein ACK40T_06340 [Akkermansiaceae bacterium]|jgi:type II secretory pathway pseudopilin PulG